MSNAVSIRCRRTYDLDESMFKDTLDQFRNTLYLPPEAFDDLGIQPYDYISARRPGENQSIRLLTADLSSDSGLIHENGYVGALRTNSLSKLVDEDSHQIETVELLVRPLPEVTQFVARTARTYDDEIRYRVCHLSHRHMQQLDINPGGSVELYNSETGGRIAVTVGFPHSNPEVVRLDVRSRQALDLTTGDDVGVRDISITRRTAFGIKRWLLKRMVDTRQMPFYVQLGPDQDEYRNIVRISVDMMNFLGVEEGQDVTLTWRGQTTKAQCLATEFGDGDPPNTIKVPATKRDEIDVSVHDSVVVERDMWSIFREQMAVSTLGIFGVIIGTLQIAPLLDVQWLVNRLGLVPAGVGTAVLLVVVSVFVVWILLMPVRQQCTSPS